MLHEEVRKAAAERLTMCKACPVCNGYGCKGKMPGPGGRGNSENFIRSYEKLQEVCIHMNVIHEQFEPNVSFSAFSQSFSAPVFAAPIGMPAQNFGPSLDDRGLAHILLEGCKNAGLCAITGDGPKDEFFEGALQEVKAAGGWGIPTVKSWPDEKLKARLKAVEDAGAFAVAMDIDCIGLLPGGGPFITRNMEQLQEALSWTRLPFILKGVMTADSAQAAVKAGAKGIVVSTHGGRVLAEAPAPIEMLPEIAERVKGRLTIFMDGGVRTGADVFRALALGADAVLVGRPFTVAAYGGGAQAVQEYAGGLEAELKQIMRMAGAQALKDIKRDMVWIQR